MICDDPRGVVECQAIRKSNVISPQKREQPSNKFEGEKKQQKRSKSLAVRIEEEKKEVGTEGGFTRELEAPAPSFQQNNVINTCPNGKKGHQKNVAKDLFRGALDLQKSLAMLKGPEKGSVGRWEDGKPCFSSRKSLAEMKSVVRDSLLRQCVITNPVFEHHFDHGKQLGSPDVPSTSSSQSSMIYSSNFAVSDISSVSSSSSSLGKLGKNSSLIFKLMGLESFPHIPLRHRESERIVNRSKPMYDIISPRARKHHFSTWLSLKQRSVYEMLEALKIKGLLTSSTGNELMRSLLPSEVLSLENELDDGKPPIVVMKPSSSPSLDLKEPIISKVSGNSGLATGEMLVKSRPRRRPSQETVRGDAPNLSEKKKEAEGGTCFEEKGKTIKKLASSKARASGNLNQKPQKMQENVLKVSEVVKVTPNRGKVEEKKVVKSSNELRYLDQTKLTPSRSQKQKDGMLVSKNQDFSRKKTAAITVLDHKMQKTCKSSSQPEKKRQPRINGKNQSSKGGSKEIDAANEKKVNATSQNDSALLTADRLIVEDFPSEKCTEACRVRVTECAIKEQISLSGPQEDVSLSASEDGSGPDPNDNQSSLINVSSTFISEHCNEDDLDENHSLLPEVTLVTTHENNGIAVNLNTLREPTTGQRQNSHPSLSQSPSSCLREVTNPETSRKFLVPRTKLKTLMLNSPSFVSQAEELFDLQIEPNSMLHASNEEDLDAAYTELLLDCAKEVMEFRSLQLSQACLPLPRSYKAHPRNTISLDRFLVEICNGIEDLKRYLSPATDMLFSDTLHLLIDRDLRFKSATWEIGWRNAFSQDEVEQVIGEVDKLVLEKFIEEVVVDFMS